MDRSDTIFALSSGKLPSGLAVIRLSGAMTRFVLEVVAGVVPSPRIMRRADFRDANGLLVDRGLCVYFRAPSSFTGEESAEFHVHGSQAVVRKLADVLSAIARVRPAEAGEFTRRAFLNGKLDLAEAEGLSDLLVAETEAQRRLAVSQSDGSLSSVYHGWRERLVYCRAMVEASIDFSDEDEVADSSFEPILIAIADVREEIGSWIARSAQSEIVRDGFKVVIIGPPNAGKSSLLNVIAGRDAAITSDEPGTTRDLVDVRLELDGNLVIVTDTAGIRGDAGKVEAIGIERAVIRAEHADLVLLLQDVSAPVDVDLVFLKSRVLKIGNKIDLSTAVFGEYDYLISTKTMSGIDTLVGVLSKIASLHVGTESVMTVQFRQKALLSECVSALTRCEMASPQADLIAENLRVATDRIGRLTGDVDVEELLGVIFSRFCIGK